MPPSRRRRSGCATRAARTGLARPSCGHRRCDRMLEEPEELRSERARLLGDRGSHLLLSKSLAETVRILDERHEPGFARSGDRAGAGGRRPPRRRPCGAGRRSASCSFARATMIEPTPACVTKARARRIVVFISSNGRKSTTSASGASVADEWPCWTTTASSIESAPTAPQQPVEPGLVRPDADEDHLSAAKTLPANRDPGRRRASSGHCT